MSKRYIYSFDDLNDAISDAGSEEQAKRLLGTKGINCSKITQFGLPCSKGFTISTEACTSFCKQNPPSFPPGLWEETLQALHNLEKQTSKKFGDSQNPLLVSCRSGTFVEMPDIMDTILNIGLTDETTVAMIQITSNPLFAWQSYSCLIRSYGIIVLGISVESFESSLSHFLEERSKKISELGSEDYQALVAVYKGLVETESGSPFPQDPFDQIRGAIVAVHTSWNSPQMVDLRKSFRISPEIGTAVLIVSMTYSNLNEQSGIGYAFTRDPNTGENQYSGTFIANNLEIESLLPSETEYLQSISKSINDLQNVFPEPYKRFTEITKQLEKLFHDMLYLEFIIEDNHFLISFATSGKRTPIASLKITTDLENEGILTKEEAISRIQPQEISSLINSTFKQNPDYPISPDAQGIPIYPGVAWGKICFNPQICDDQSILLLENISNEDMTNENFKKARGYLIANGGSSSNSSLFLLSCAKPAITACPLLQFIFQPPESIESDQSYRRNYQESNYDLIRKNQMIVLIGSTQISEGEPISIDGTTGAIYLQSLEPITPEVPKDLEKIISWSNKIRDNDSRIGESFNTGPKKALRQAKEAKEKGAEGFGLIRTEGMFVSPERKAQVQKLLFINPHLYQQSLLALNQPEFIINKDSFSEIPGLSDVGTIFSDILESQKAIFSDLFTEAGSFRTVVRLFDPFISDYLPNEINLSREITILETKNKIKSDLLSPQQKEELKQKIDLRNSLKEFYQLNPLIGLRGIRFLFICLPLLEAQLSAIIEGAFMAASRGIDVHPYILIPYVSHPSEVVKVKLIFDHIYPTISLKFDNKHITFRIGSLIENPLSTQIISEITKVSDFLSFGTNDLNALALSLDRENENGIISKYIELGIFDESPFISLDPELAEIIKEAVKEARTVKPGIEIGLCGEQATNPKTIALCHQIGLDYISCIPPKLLPTKLITAQVSLREDP